MQVDGILPPQTVMAVPVGASHPAAESTGRKLAGGRAQRPDRHLPIQLYAALLGGLHAVHFTVQCLLADVEVVRDL